MTGPTPDELINNRTPLRAYAGPAVPNGPHHVYLVRDVPGHPAGPVPLRARCGVLRHVGLPLAPIDVATPYPAASGRCSRCVRFWAGTRRREGYPG